MSQTPKLSVIVRTYNVARYIKKTLDSILKQQVNFSYEVVIGNDFSTDNTLEIVQEYKEKYPDIIRVLERKIGDKYYKNRQKFSIPGYNLVNLIQNSKGRYIAVLDGDDYWNDPLKLQKQVDFLEKNPDYGLTCSDIDLTDENGKYIPATAYVKELRKNFKSGFIFFEHLQKFTINTCTVVFLKNAINIDKEINKKNLKYINDYWLWLNISMNYKVHYFADKLATYRTNKKEGVTVSKMAKNKPGKARYEMIKKYVKKHHNKLSQAEKKLLRKHIINLLLGQKVTLAMKVDLFWFTIISMRSLL